MEEEGSGEDEAASADGVASTPGADTVVATVAVAEGMHLIRADPTWPRSCR